MLALFNHLLPNMTGVAQDTLSLLVLGLVAAVRARANASYIQERCQLN